MLVAVGGHSRNIGKTSVVAELIAALPHHNWAAMKITQYGHGVCSAEGESCDCAADLQHPYTLTEETAPGGTDSGRFLAAGARRSYWLRTPVGGLGEAVPAVRAILEANENVIVESNSIVQFFRPDLYIVVLDFGVADFKPSALRYLDLSDAVVTVGDADTPAWAGVARRLWESKPRFAASPPPYVSAGLAAFAESRLASAALPNL